MTTKNVDRKRNKEEAERKCADSITNDPPAPYGDVVPRMAEDGTADVANYGEAQYLQGK